MAKQAMTISVEDFLVGYVEQRSEHESISRSEIANEAFLQSYKNWLANQMQEGFAAQTDEDVAMAEGDMGDYKKIITRDE